ncbi:hypothetical protein MMC18_004967 [Xylographa bjoerkii]|nr:hypothetical protein [Xylographa bjoerkii]
MDNSGQGYDGSNKRRRVDSRDFLGVDSSAPVLAGSESNNYWPGELDWSYSPNADALAIQPFDHSWQWTGSPLVSAASIGAQPQRKPLDAHSTGSDWAQQVECYQSELTIGAGSADPVHVDFNPSQTAGCSTPSLLAAGAAQGRTPWERNPEDISPPSVVSARSDASSTSKPITSLVLNGDVVNHHSKNRYGICQSNDEYQICFDKYLGALDAQTARALANLSSDYMVYLDAYIHVEQRAGFAKSGNKSTESFDVHVIIYGNREELDGVGTSLMKHDIYLQHPQGQDETVPYDNPHYLKRPGSEIDISSVRSTKDHEGHQPLTTGTIESIFVSSEGPPKWQEVNTSMRLKTALKTHQKKGLAMMVERECGNTEDKNDFATLWTINSGADNKPKYKNIVSGRTQSARPALYLGGLLADEMGLGKTLTVLALITGSLDTERPAPYLRQSTDLISHELNNCKSTLIITPKSTLQSWDEQIKKHIHTGSLRVHVYHGAKRISEVSKLAEFDVVITTYATLLAEWSSTTKRSSKRIKALYSCNWHRVVLDEAHVIRDSMAKQSRAAHSLVAQHRWCLTGTPIQNRIEDLGALLLFLRVEPFDTRSTFKNHIADPVNANKKRSIERLQMLVGAIALRRTKESIKSDLQLPSRINSVQEVRLTASENDPYMTNRNRILEEVNHVYSEDGKPKGFCGILQSILRLRQICNFGNNVSLYSGNRGEQFNAPGCLSPLRLERCELCGKGMETTSSESEPTLTLCMHALCAACASSGQESIPTNAQICPLCHGTASSEDLSEMDDSEDQIIEE